MGIQALQTAASTCVMFCDKVKNVSPELAEKFFDGTMYTDKVLRQMQWEGQAQNAAPGYHAFPELVKNFAGNGNVINGTGDAFRTLNIPGGYNGLGGTFQFMKNSEGLINHRLFIPY